MRQNHTWLQRVVDIIKREITIRYVGDTRLAEAFEIAIQRILKPVLHIQNDLSPLTSWETCKGICILTISSLSLMQKSVALALIERTSPLGKYLQGPTRNMCVCQLQGAVQNQAMF